MTPLVKSLIGIGLAGGGAGLSIGGYYLFKESEPKTLSEKLNKEGLHVLDYSATSNTSGSGDYDKWTQKLSDYNGNEHEGKRFTNLNKPAEQQKLIDECQKHLEKSPEEIEKTTGLKEKVKFWCTVEKS